MPTATMMVEAKKKREKVTILYASESGKSQTFAEQLLELFDHAFNGRVSDLHQCAAFFDHFVELPNYQIRSSL